ncbi:hypothetical protein AWM68_19700 [Fictibacillus phosphorivorans]|uniref:Uncharacterized protein n=1 Tax=Fictibacillus phosphorivorans TaxID=1221500 RepID=A0A165NRB0_9BACL|nr:hypothetical protein [Fictibacillus phosphorivorans]KZE67345.1 hypothetical protein AWM68_19700 [Fictibacillus phosphorivorans]
MNEINKEIDGENPILQNGQEQSINHISQSLNKVDLNSMMQLATTLLKNETLMSSVTNKMKQNAIANDLAEKPTPKTSPTVLEKISTELTRINEQLNTINRELLELKKLVQTEKRLSKFQKFLSIFKG